MKKFFYWLPRVLAILFIVFMSLFALDVFSEPKWILALTFHLIPNFILIILTIIAWKHKKLGGILFLIAALTMSVFYNSFFIAIPPFIIGILFLISDL